MRRVIQLVCLVCLVWLLACVQSASARNPNIVFVYTDDQAPWAVQASRHPHALTPHLDRLINQGAYLVNSFTTTPVCSPSRASLMTARYGSELGVTDWIHPRNEPNLGLDPATVVWPEVLQQHGYATGLVGKWHLGVPPEFHPTRTGFDYFMGFLTGGTTPRDPLLESDGQNRKFTGFTPDILTDHALRFIEQNRQREILLCLHFRAPHARWLPVPDEDWQPFRDLDPSIPNPDYPKLDTARVKQMTREYLASVHSVDRNVGRLLERLDQLGIADNTVLIFTSDHGYNMGHNGIWHKGNGHWVLTEPPPATKNIPRNQRPNMYDNSIRVPTVVRWPGVVKPGRVIRETVSNLDWYRTIVQIAGAQLPPGETVRGRSIVPLLRGENIPWDNEFYGEYSTHHQSHTDMRMIRTPDWKLVRDFLNPARDELYDLRSDPAESTNLIRSDDTRIVQVISQLHAKILEKMKQNQDPVLEPERR